MKTDTLKKMLLMLLCVVVRAWRIANENPVKSIKVE